MRSLRFWQKTYLLTLALFLATLFGGVAFMGWQNQQQTLEREVEGVRAEQRFIAQSLARDLGAVDGGGARLRSASLARSYGEHYGQDGVLLDVSQGGTSLFSNVPFAEGDTGPTVESGTTSWTIEKLGDDERYLVVASALPEPSTSYQLTCARSLEGLYADWDGMRRTLIIGCLLASVTLAAGLFFILRSLVRPLEKLARTADEFAAGDFTARATKRTDDEIGTLATSFNAMADAAERNIAEISRIAEQNARVAANLSHEIRTPLTTVRGWAEYLRQADASVDEHISALDCIVEESGRIQALSQRMLQFSTLGPDEMERAPVNLEDIVERAVRSVEPAAREAGVTLRASTLEHVRIEGDGVLLESLVVNLLDNAMKACAAGGSVVVDLMAESAGNGAVLRVADDGRGLSPAELARLGEPFYRPDKARSRAAGGAGLGVALCFQIAKLHGATLRYVSEVGKGTTATIMFTAS